METKNVKPKKSRRAKYVEEIHQAVLIRCLRAMQTAGFWLTCAGDQNAAKRGSLASSAAKMTGLAPGEPDVRIYLPMGVCLFAELKTEHGRLSKDQVRRHADLAALGHKVIVAKSDHPLTTTKIVLDELAKMTDWVQDELYPFAERACEEVLTALGRK